MLFLQAQELSKRVMGMEIREEMKMTDAIHLNHLLITVVNRFGISMGFGDKTIREICDQNQIDTDFFLQIVNSFHDENYFPRLQFLNFPISRFIEYLRRAHADYLYRNIPEIETLLEKLAKSYQGEQAHITFLQKFFSEYKNELVIHINREEQRVFPYVIDLETAYKKLEIDENLHNRIIQYSIGDYFDEHNNVEEKLYDLKNILIKYFPKGGDIHLKEELLHRLFALEKDLNRHSLMEDKVLVPKVAMIERELQLVYQARLVNQNSPKELESKDIRTQLKEKFADHGEPDQSDLSKREKEIIRQVALGLTSKEIADKLFISLHTVLTHRKNINRKLGIKTVSGITVYAILNGVVNPDEIA